MLDGKLIRDLRKAKGLSQDQLAAMCGYADKSMISRLESGDINDIPLSKAIQLAKELGVTPTQLLK